MDKPVCDYCKQPVRVATSEDSSVWAGDWMHENGYFDCLGTSVATVNGSETAPKEPASPEPVDVDELVRKAAIVGCEARGVGKWSSYSEDLQRGMLKSSLEMLRVFAEALGQTERLWPKPKTPKAVQEAISLHCGANPADWVKQLAIDCYRIGLEGKEGQSNG